MDEVMLALLRKDAAEIARLKSALESIRAVAEESNFGGWRFKVAAIVDNALGKK